MKSVNISVVLFFYLYDYFIYGDESKHGEITTRLKYDIRTWHPGREKCGKGITLTEEEARALMNALKEVFEA